MRIKRKHIMWAAAGVVFGAFTWFARREKPIDVDTDLVRQGTLMVTVDAEGRTRVRDRYMVAAPVGGRLQRIELDEGARVRAGDVVARIAPMPLDAQSSQQARARLDAATSMVRDAEARVRQAEASLDHGRRTVSRVVRLVEAGALAERDREDAQLTLQLREDELEAARSRARAAVADVEQARAALLTMGSSPGATILVRSPVSGRILRIPERSERVIGPGVLLAEVGDPGAIEIVVDILSSDAARVRRGARVMLEHWGDGEALAGQVRQVEPAAFTRVSALGVEEQRVNVVVDVTGPPIGLGDGYRVEARIVVREQVAAVIVPVSALFRQGAEWAVFLVDDGRAVVTLVRVGDQGGTDVEVLSGLEAGDEVILFPSDQVRHGTRVAAGTSRGPA